MVVDEDPFPLVVSINIAATNLRTMLNAKKVGRFSLSVRIRKVWIPKQYLVHTDDLTARRRVSTVREREKNGRYPYHSKQEIKKEKFSKGDDVSPKEIYVSLGEKGMNNLSRRKMPPRFVVPPLVSHGQKWDGVKHKKFLKSSPEPKKEECRDRELWRKGNYLKKCYKESQKKHRILKKR